MTDASHSEVDQELEGIAVVGLAGRFPGAKSPAELWENLKNGVESITFFSDEALIAAGVDPALVRDPGYVKACGALGDAEMFDASFFGLNPREAALMDPQHRLFLECSWEAMESAGYSPDRQPGRTGVFGGMSMNTYLLSNVYGHIAHVASVESLQASIGNDKDSLTTEVAYRLNLRGPAVTVQSSSSTSLTVIHFACQSLLNHECDMALAGGVSIHFPETAGYMFYEGGTTSPDGHCRTFDAKAKGFVAGHGAGVVALRRLADAVADGDTIYAVVKGSAVNNDGSAKVSYMAPAIDGQAEVIELAQAVAGVDPESIGYVEGHGTATPIGDPIELAALTKAFRSGTDKKGFCAIGSIKTNIGHLDAAAGVAGFIKATLALHHRQIPPSLHYDEPNPAIDFPSTPFFVNTELRPFPEGPGGGPRRAGVTSLGMGGTNAHAILEEAPAIARAERRSEGGATGEGGRARPSVVVLSARDEATLEASMDRLASHLAASPDVAIEDVAYTLQHGRRALPRRAAVVARDASDARDALASRDPRVLVGGHAISGRPILFLFPGQGSQHVDMGRGLYESEPVFRAEIDACAERLRGPLGLDLRALLYPPPDVDRAEAAAALQQTKIAQPALFVVEYALARLWTSWGIAPSGMIGHSVGEYVAACLAGVVDRDDALALVAARGRLMQGVPSGEMLAVSLPEAEVRPLLDGDVSLASVNSVATCVVAGPPAAIERVSAALTARGVSSQRLHTSHAFHSPMMDPILDAFRAEVARLSLSAPKIPFLSNVTGAWAKAAEVRSADYWARHLRQTVRFADGVGQILKDPDAILLEVGPGRTLSTLAQQHPSLGERHVTIASLRHARGHEPDDEHVRAALARLWLAGAEPDWSALHGEPRRRVPLPTYPFDRQRHWVEPKASDRRAAGAGPAASADAKAPVDRWFYAPSWRRAAAKTPPRVHGAETARERSRFLLLARPGASIAERLAERLERDGHGVVVATLDGGALREVRPGRWTIDPVDGAAYASLVEQLAAAGTRADHVVHLGHPTGAIAEDAASFDRAQAIGSTSLLLLSQALSRVLARTERAPRSVVSVTCGAHAVGDEPRAPEEAASLGMVRVLAEEHHPEIAYRSVDVYAAPAGRDEEALVDRLAAECVAIGAEPEVALRRSGRWTPSFERIDAPDAAAGRAVLRDRGAYLIVGGLGNLGYNHAEVLAKRARARLVLVAQRALPERSAWDAHVASHAEDDPSRARILQVRALEALGAEVLVERADASDAAQLRAAIDRGVARVGPLHGAIFAAGAVDESLFCPSADLTPADLAARLRVRVHGLYAFAAALGRAPLDFCVVDSSMASILGGVGRAAYATATSFMDAFAELRASDGDAPWLSVSWDGWEFAATSASAALGRASPLGHLAIARDEGADAFERLLGLASLRHVAVCTSDLAARAHRARGGGAAGKADVEAAAPKTIDEAARAPRRALHNAYVAPRDELEAAVAAAWAETLGIAEVGVHDNFFDLGGNSLVGVKLIARLRDQLGVAIAPVALFEKPTVDGIATLVRRARAAAGAAAGEAPPPDEDAEELEGADARGERRRGRLQRRRDGSGDGS